MSRLIGASTRAAARRSLKTTANSILLRIPRKPRPPMSLRRWGSGIDAGEKQISDGYTERFASKER